MNTSQKMRNVGKNNFMRKLALIMLFAIILCKSVYADDLLHYFDTSGIEASVEKKF